MNFSLWILFVLDYLLFEITTPLIVYIWRRRGGTCKFGYEFHKIICCYFNLATRLYQLWQWAIVMLTWQYCIPLWIVVIYRYFNLTTHLCQFERFYHYFNIITLLPFFIAMLQYDWLWSGHMVIKVMFHIPMKLSSR
jgi:hypothetical protein